MPGSIVGCVWQFDGSRPASVTSMNAKTREKRSGRSNNGYASEGSQRPTYMIDSRVYLTMGSMQCLCTGVYGYHFSRGSITNRTCSDTQDAFKMCCSAALWDLY
ncbi:hypothetical protein JOM56_010129 [Amanita muscaria]